MQSELEFNRIQRRPPLMRSFLAQEHNARSTMLHVIENGAVYTEARDQHLAQETADDARLRELVLNKNFASLLALPFKRFWGKHASARRT